MRVCAFTSINTSKILHPGFSRLHDGHISKQVSKSNFASSLNQAVRSKQFEARSKQASTKLLFIQHFLKLLFLGFEQLEIDEKKVFSSKIRNKKQFEIHGWSDRRSGPKKFGPYFFWSGPWSENFVRVYSVRSVVRYFGTKVTGTVRGPLYFRTNLVRSEIEIRNKKWFCQVMRGEDFGNNVLNTWDTSLTAKSGMVDLRLNS